MSSENKLPPADITPSGYRNSLSQALADACAPLLAELQLSAESKLAAESKSAVESESPAKLKSAAKSESAAETKSAKLKSAESKSLTDWVVVEVPRERGRGDFSCAVALRLASVLRRPPAAIAADILRRAALPNFVKEAKVDGGYINFQITTAAKLAIAGEVLRRGEDFGRAAAKNKTVLLEFVSANPTGPLHIGHGRAAAYGDSLARILEFAGWEVRREYYVNDAGRQAEILAASVWLRGGLGGGELPSGAYRGEYLTAAESAAESLHTNLSASDAADLRAKMESAKDDDAAADLLAAAFRQTISDNNARGKYIRCVAEAVLKMIRKDLQKLEVADFHQWFSEQKMHDDDSPAAAIAELQKRGHLYEEEGALWFRSAAAGDDKDRVLRRADGRYTYFAADIAYHRDKFLRGADVLINVLGADHHGYVPRLRAAVAALGYDANKMETVLIQFVSLVNSGQRIKMSTRGGKFVPLEIFVDEIGKDAARFFYVCRKNDRHLDVDMQLAVENSRKNPVFYMHYAHARADKVLRSWEETGGSRGELAKADWGGLQKNPSALELCARMSEFPFVAAQAAKDRAAHSLAAFLQELAAALHHYYETTPILADPPDDGMRGRLALLYAAQTVLRNGLRLLGISAREKM